MITLEVIIPEIEISQSSWLDEVLKAVLHRFGRMVIVCCEKLLCAISIHDLKNQVNSAFRSVLVEAVIGGVRY
ncbi:unnamed protein product [Thelazia callipaeda]|uniref:DUF2179 domain-containing protein n=1 Tax=Thelazia callipaeda TaxID=103827 RepID=A0A0N5CTQ8_THECL|nr:unnamed protein product [Thelazia callipaeda]